MFNLFKPKKSYHLIRQSGGVAGVKQTLNKMAQLVNQGKTTKEIREKAMVIVRGCNDFDYINEASCLHAWVRDRIRYVKDVRGVETLQTPLLTLNLRAGDCDDQTTLFCALAEAIGHKTRMVAVSSNGFSFCHVYPEILIGSKWIACECIHKNYNIGKRPAPIKKTIIKLN